MCSPWKRTQEQASAVKENRAVPKDQDLNVVWPTETEASRTTEHKDDPEEESTQSEEETSEKL